MKFLIESPITAKSFDDFADTPPLTDDENDMLARVIIADGRTGLEYMNSFTDKNAAKNILYNEIVSHLMRRLYSAISCLDFFEENLMEQASVNLRTKDAKQIANLFAGAYGINPSTFDDSFFILLNNEFRNNTLLQGFEFYGFSWFSFRV